jgi:hypothetical protein
MKLPDRMSAIHLGANLANAHQVLDSIHWRIEHCAGAEEHPVAAPRFVKAMFN